MGLCCSWNVLKSWSTLSSLPITLLADGSSRCAPTKFYCLGFGDLVFGEALLIRWALMTVWYIDLYIYSCSSWFVTLDKEWSSFRFLFILVNLAMSTSPPLRITSA